MSKTTTFKAYWSGVQLPLELHRLRQYELDALTQIAKQAFHAGKKAGKQETT